MLWDKKWWKCQKKDWAGNFRKESFKNSGHIVDNFSHIKSNLYIFTKIVFTFYNKAQGQGQVSFRL